MDTIRKNIVRRNKYARQFQQVFKVPLSQYFDNLTGFDICRFDTDFIRVSDNKSMREQVSEYYGPEAVQIILGLIS